MSERRFFGDGTGAAFKRAGGKCELCHEWRTTTSRMMRTDRRWYWVCAECDDIQAPAEGEQDAERG